MAIDADLLNEDCAAISGWTDADVDTAVSEVDPAGQFRFDTNTGAAGNAYAYRRRDIASPPNQFTVEIKTYFDTIGATTDTDHAAFYYTTATWFFYVEFGSDGLLVLKTGAGKTEVGADIVKHGGAAAWQTWRFEVDKSGGEAAATVEVFLDNVSQGVVDCDYEGGTPADGRCILIQYGFTTNDMVTHFDYVKIGTGLGEFPSEANAIMFGANF